MIISVILAQVLTMPLVPLFYVQNAFWGNLVSLINVGVESPIKGTLSKEKQSVYPEQNG